METHLKFLSDDKLLEKHLISTCEYFCRMSSTKSRFPEFSEISWMALAKLTRLCKGDMHRKIISRLQKRILDLEKRPVTVGAAHFICAVLASFPSLKHSNSEACAVLMGRLVDYGVQSGSSRIASIAAYAFSLYADDSSEELLLSAIRQSLTGYSESEVASSSLVRFATCRYRNSCNDFVAMVFRINSMILERHSPGFVISVSEWLDVAREALKLDSNVIAESVFEWLGKLVLFARLNAGPFTKRIMALFLDFPRPSNAFYDAFNRFYFFVGPPDRTTSALNFLWKTAAQPWYEQQYAVAYAETVSTILLSKTYLLRPQDLVSVQRKICNEVLQNPTRRLSLRLLTSLLGVNHELIPSPLQLAQRIFSFLRVNEESFYEVRLGQFLCGCLSRPKAHLIPHFDKWSKKMEVTVQSREIGGTATNYCISPTKETPYLKNVKTCVPAECAEEAVVSLGVQPNIEKITESLPSTVITENNQLTKGPSQKLEEKGTSTLSNDQNNSGVDLNVTGKLSVTEAPEEALLKLQTGNATNVPGNESNDLVILEGASNENSRNMVPNKRKLVCVWSDGEDWNTVPVKKSESGESVLKSDSPTKKTCEVLSAEQMMEDLYID